MVIWRFFKPSNQCRNSQNHRLDYPQFSFRFSRIRRSLGRLGNVKAEQRFRFLQVNYFICAELGAVLVISFLNIDNKTAYNLRQRQISPVSSSRLALNNSLDISSAFSDCSPISSAMTWICATM